MVKLLLKSLIVLLRDAFATQMAIAMHEKGHTQPELT